MPKVFISYAREDKSFANRLANELEKREVSIWIDSRSIPPGEEWLSAIERGLEECDYFLLVLTPSAMLSNYVTEERTAAYRRAVNGDMIFIPLLVIRADYTSLLLGSRQWIDFSQSFSPNETQDSDWDAGGYPGSITRSLSKPTHR